jgi:hypothetical protein
VHHFFKKIINQGPDAYLQASPPGLHLPAPAEPKLFIYFVVQVNLFKSFLEFGTIVFALRSNISLSCTAASASSDQKRLSTRTFGGTACEV